jgi:hypothetical protein
VEQSPSRIDKLEEIINNLGSAFSSVKTIERTPPHNNSKFMYVPKNKGASSSKGDEDIKMISVHPNFIDIIKEPIVRNKFLNFITRSVIVKDMHANSPRKHGCIIEELDLMDDNT